MTQPPRALSFVHSINATIKNYCHHPCECVAKKYTVEDAFYSAKMYVKLM